MPNRLSLSGGAAVIQDLETRPCANCEERTETVGVYLDHGSSTDDTGIRFCPACLARDASETPMRIQEETGVHFCPACLARDAIKTLVWIQEEYPGVVTLDSIIHDYAFEKYKEVGPEDE